jgi:hypothetical protein
MVNLQLVQAQPKAVQRDVRPTDDPYVKNAKEQLKNGAMLLAEMAQHATR